MPRRLSIGIRWAIRYSVAVSVTLTVFGIVIYSQVAARINREARLVSQVEAHGLLDSLRTQTEEHPREEVMRWLRSRAEREVAESDPVLGLGIEYLDAHGHSVLRTGSLASAVAPLPRDLLKGEREETFQALNLGGRRAHFVTSLAAPHGFLQVAISTERFGDNIAHVRDVMLLAFPMMLAVTAVLGWLLARGSLRPISAMSATARRVSASNLDERVPVSGTGDELDQLAATLNAMMERIQDGVVRMRRFNANAAHELRSPLARICSEIELALEQDLSDDSREKVLGDVLSRVRSLGGAVDALLRLSQLEAGLDRDQLARVDLAELLETVAEFFEPLATAEGQELVAGPFAASQVLGDRTWLYQLFSNLVDNAIKYGGRGNRIQLASEVRGDRVVASVRDTGPGLPPGPVTDLFDRFQRGALHRDRPGFGLGLPLAREIARAHGGEILARDESPHGSLFEVELPVAGPRAR